VESENITTGEKKHCNSSYLTMVAKDEHGNNVPVPGLIIENEQGVRRFSRSMRRKEQAMKRRSKFKASKFKVEEHLEQLKGENVKIEYKK
jgi:hypothetical protein